MKKIIVLAMVAVLGIGVVFAQSKRGQRGVRPPRMNTEQRVSHMKESLKLTDEQASKISALYADFEAGMKNPGKVGRDAMKAKRDSLDMKVKELLTDEQKAKYDSLNVHRPMTRGRQGNRK